MENNNKGTSIFLGVIGVATLIVAIIGATFAFFGAQIEGGTGNLAATSAKLALGFEDDTTGINVNLIPAEYWIANHAATNTEYLKTHEECVDENGNEVCGTYTFTVGNPSTTTAQTLYASVKVLTNGFSDLWFRIYDEKGTEVVAPTKFTGENSEIKLPQLTQTLLASSDGPADGKDAIVDSTPSTYKLVEGQDTNKKTAWNKRTYKMIIWIEETKTDQTETNSGMSFTGSLYFTTANDTTGVTGVIGAAQKPSESAPDNPVDANQTQSGNE